MVEQKLELYPFQKEGVEFIIQKKKALIADMMGLGKTVQAIMATQQIGCFPCVVIAPKSVVVNWKNEIEKWGGTATIINSKTDFQDLPHVQYYVLNYDIVNKKLEVLTRLPYQAIILDEIHYAKNYKAQRSKAVSYLIENKYDKSTKTNPLIVIGLSGTPILNHGTEIHQIAKLIDPYCLGFSFFTFANRYCVPATFGGYELDHTKIGELNERLKTIMLRRRKEEVLKDLPQKTRSDVEVCIEQDKYLAELRAKIKELKEKYQDDRQIILGLMAVERRITGILKAEKAVEFILDRLAETDEKIVVFAHHKEVIKKLSERLAEEGYANTIYTGDMTDTERQKAIDDFRDKNRVVIISVHAGGTGINLQFASYVVFVELDWSPSQLQQAEDRCHRIGQLNNVTVYYLFAKNTIDENITTSVIRKMGVINAMIDNLEIQAEEDKNNAYRNLLRVI